jgi:hypothetical protein
MRRPRQSAEPSQFSVIPVALKVRELITTSVPPPEGISKALPPIVRIQPLPEQDDQTLANVKATWEEQGAHVRMLAREHLKPEVVAASVVREQVTVRKMVMLVMHEVRSEAPDLLKGLILQTMERAGL